MLAGAKYGYFDLTEEKRYTLTEPTKELLGRVDDVVDVRVLLEGDFPSGFKRLQSAVRDMLDDFRSQSKYIEYTFEDPSIGDTEEVNERRKILAEQGIIPTNLLLKASGEKTQKLIYPYAIFHHKGRRVAVNILENEVPGVPPEETLNNSIGLLEYKFANAIQKLRASGRKNVLFTAGNGELDVLETKSLVRNLQAFYNTGRVNLNEVVRLPPDTVDVLVIAKPRAPFSEKEKFLIDQYIMNGGKVLWLIDQLAATLDSMRTRPEYIPREYDLGLDDMLFKYGVRINTDLVLDMEAAKIPQVIGQVGDNPQIDLFTWYYHPVAVPAGSHPIVHGLDRVQFDFPNSIDTILTKVPVRKTVLLQSSPYSRVQRSPIRLNFNILQYEPDPAKFNKGPQILAVLLEGQFASLYRNRVPEAMKEGLKELGQQYKDVSDPTRMIVVSDGDVARNLVNPQSGEYAPLGYNPYEKYQYANQNFLFNAIEYLLDDSGVLKARTKEVKLRLLDGVRVQQEKPFWQMFNIVLPIFAMVVFGMLYNVIRQQRFFKMDGSLFRTVVYLLLLLASSVIIFMIGYYVTIYYIFKN